MIAQGPRTDAARAQIMRGDIKMAQNQVEARGAGLPAHRDPVREREGRAARGAVQGGGRAGEAARRRAPRRCYKKLVEEYPDEPARRQRPKPGCKR